MVTFSQFMELCLAKRLFFIVTAHISHYLGCLLVSDYSSCYVGAIKCSKLSQFDVICYVFAFVRSKIIPSDHALFPERRDCCDQTFKYNKKADMSRL